MKIEKLAGENARLTEELREMTGDDLPEVTGDSPAAAPSSASASRASTNRARLSPPTPKRNASRTSSDDGEASTATVPASGDGADDPELTGDGGGVGGGAAAGGRGSGGSTPEGGVGDEMEPLDFAALERWVFDG